MSQICCLKKNSNDYINYIVFINFVQRSQDQNNLVSVDNSFTFLTHSAQIFFAPILSKLPLAESGGE